MNLRKKKYIYASIKCDEVCAIKANNTDKKIEWNEKHRQKKRAKHKEVCAYHRHRCCKQRMNLREWEREANGKWKEKLSKQQIGYGNKMNGIKVFFIVIRFYSPAMFRAEMFIVSLVFLRTYGSDYAAQNKYCQQNIILTSILLLIRYCCWCWCWCWHCCICRVHSSTQFQSDWHLFSTSTWFLSL